jgi:uncharacterized protein (UPF0261 family)
VDMCNFWGIATVPEKYKNRVAILTADDQAGIFNVNKKAQRLWAIQQVVKDLSVEDTQYKKAKETLAEDSYIQTDQNLVM